MGRVFKPAGRSKWRYKVRLSTGVWKTRIGFTDKRATEQRQAQDQRAIDRGEVGLLDQFAGTRSTPLAELAAAFEVSLQARARNARYVSGLMSRLALVFEVTGASRVHDLDAATIEVFLGRLVRGEDLPPKPAPPHCRNQVPRGAASMRTRDTYVEALRTFGSWLASTERWPNNPFARLRKEARESDRTMEHRALDADELRRLVAAAETRNLEQWVRGGEKGGGHVDTDAATRSYLADLGFARGSLYLFAAYTGLRLNECRHVQRGHLMLLGDEPHVLVRAATAKARKEKLVPLIVPVVARLQALLATQDLAAAAAGRIVQPDAPMFVVPRNLLKQLRADARFAGLGLHDAAGRTLTFHGFRASTATLLVRAGVSPAMTMRVLRHSDPKLTLQLYAKLGLADVHRELREKLPEAAPAPRVGPNQALRAAATRRSSPSDRAWQVAVGSMQESEFGSVAPIDAAPRRATPQQSGEAEIGGPCRIRTCDFDSVKIALYQLS